MGTLSAARDSTQNELFIRLKEYRSQFTHLSNNFTTASNAFYNNDDIIFKLALAP